MRLLGAPPLLAALATLLAILSHPALQAAEWMPAHATVLPVLTLLAAASLVVSKAGSGSGRLLALGAASLVLGLAYDSVRGHTGAVTLQPGQGLRSFEEDGPGGRRLGLRPLGFDLVLEDLGPAGEATLVSQSGRARVTAERAASLGGFRFGSPRQVAMGDAHVLRLAVGGGGATERVELVAGGTARVDDLTIALEQYFPDFALDEKGQPFSRSSEPRNPAAVLRVQRDGRSWRVFVIRALPDIHKLEGLDRTFSLLEVEAERAVTLSVARQPAAGLVAAGVLLVAIALARSR